MSSTSSIEASSTTTTSASSGHSSLRANPPVMPCAPSSRCTVTAGWSVSSSSRLAARPVGAASATSVPLACSSFTMAATVRLLPVPGPPVSRLTPAPSTCATACFCASSRPLATERTDAGSAIRSAAAARRATFSATASSAMPKRASDSIRSAGSGSAGSPSGSPSSSGIGGSCSSTSPDVDRGDHRGGGVGDALGAQRGDDEVGGQDGVPVPRRGAQREPHDRPGPGGRPAGRRR